MALSLGLLVRHHSCLVPDADDHSLVGPHDAGAAATLSAEVDRVVLGVVLHEHVLLVGDSNTGLARLAVALSGLEDALELVDIDLLLGAILLEEVELVVVESEAGGSGPGVAVEAVDGGELVDAGEGVLLGGSVVLVGDLVKISVPG